MISPALLLFTACLSLCFCAFSLDTQSHVDVLAEFDPSKLFAIVGGSSCAESLYYGPQDMTTSGSADGHAYYLSTKVGLSPHDTWLQIVTNAYNQEVFRIYWNFSSRKTIPERIANAVASGESVNYLVVHKDSGFKYPYSGIWRFSDAAGVTTNTFTKTYTDCCFSADSGVWGAGDGVINGNSATAASKFWGVGNYDSTDSDSCSLIYKEGYSSYNSNFNTKSYMYFDVVQQPTYAPTSSPLQNSVVSMKASQDVEGATSSDNFANTVGFTSVFASAVAASIPGINAGDVREMMVYPRYGDRCYVEYYVTVSKSRGIKYSQMAAAITESVNTNQFTTLMQGFAVQLNVPALQTATSNSVTVQSASYEVDAMEIEPWYQTPSAIAGLTIGCIVFVGAAIYIIYMYMRMSGSVYPPGSMGVGDTGGGAYGPPPAGGNSSYIVPTVGPGAVPVGTGPVSLAGAPYASLHIEPSAPPKPSTFSSFSLFNKSDPSHTRW